MRCDGPGYLSGMGWRNGKGGYRTFPPNAHFGLTKCPPCDPTAPVCGILQQLSAIQPPAGQETGGDGVNRGGAGRGPGSASLLSCKPIVFRYKPKAVSQL
jgi:hypothetical protein